MSERKQINISLKTFVIVVLSVIILLAIVVLYCIYFSRNASSEWDISYEPDIAIINYDGSFKAKGVVVRPETDYLVIMPIVANEEYTAHDNYFYENDNKLNLKQGQEVEINFHYREPTDNSFYYEAVVDNIEILHDKSDIDIPRDIFVKAYSSKDKISLSFTNEKCDSKGMQFIITDSNDFKYNYSTMKYSISKHNNPPAKSDETSTNTISGYDPWPEVSKISNLSTTSKYSLDGKGNVEVAIDWSNVYGKLSEGEYKLTFSTVLSQRQSILNPQVIDFPYDGVSISVQFKVNASGRVEFGDVTIY